MLLSNNRSILILSNNLKDRNCISFEIYSDFVTYEKKIHILIILFYDIFWKENKKNPIYLVSLDADRTLFFLNRIP